MKRNVIASRHSLMVLYACHKLNKNQIMWIVLKDLKFVHWTSPKIHVAARAKLRADTKYLISRRPSQTKTKAQTFVESKQLEPLLKIKDKHFISIWMRRFSS